MQNYKCRRTKVATLDKVQARLKSTTRTWLFWRDGDCLCNTEPIIQAGRAKARPLI